MNPDTRIAIVSLSVLVFLSAIYLAVWVFHNIRISRRLQRRRVRKHDKKQPIQDFLGRWIVVDHPDRLLKANYIEVEVKSSTVQDKTVEEKIFRVAPARHKK